MIPLSCPRRGDPAIRSPGDRSGDHRWLALEPRLSGIHRDSPAFSWAAAPPRSGSAAPGFPVSVPANPLLERPAVVLGALRVFGLGCSPGARSSSGNRSSSGIRCRSAFRCRCGVNCRARSFRTSFPWRRSGSMRDRTPLPVLSHASIRGSGTIYVGVQGSPEAPFGSFTRGDCPTRT